MSNLTVLFSSSILMTCSGPQPFNTGTATCVFPNRLSRGSYRLAAPNSLSTREASSASHHPFYICTGKLSLSMYSYSQSGKSHLIAKHESRFTYSLTSCSKSLLMCMLAIRNVQVMVAEYCTACDFPCQSVDFGLIVQPSRPWRSHSTKS